MEWTQHGEGFEPEGKTVTKGIETLHNASQSSTSNLIIAVNSSENASYYSCKMYFANYSGKEETTANNVPSFTYIWNSSVIALYASLSSTQSVHSETDIRTSATKASSTPEKATSVDWCKCY